MSMEKEKKIPVLQDVVSREPRAKPASAEPAQWAVSDIETAVNRVMLKYLPQIRKELIEELSRLSHKPSNPK